MLLVRQLPDDRRCLATPQQKRELAFESSWRKTVGMNPPLRQREILHLGMRVKIRKRQQTLKQDRGHAGLTIPPIPRGQSVPDATRSRTEIECVGALGAAPP